MSFIVNYNGVNYTIPEYGDIDWGPDVTAYLNALATGSLTKSGGLFPLLADVNFGAAHGVLAGFFSSAESNPAAAGQIRLTHSGEIHWRNNANTADVTLGVNASDRLTFNGSPIADTATWGFITGTLSDQTDLQNALNLKADETNPQFTATGYLYANGGSNASFSTTIPTSNLAGTVNLTTQVSGVLPIANGGTNGNNAASAFNNLSPTVAKGDIIVNTGGANTALPVAATNGLVLTVDDTSPYGVSYQAPGVVPVITSTGQAPYYIPGGDTFTVDVNKQVLFNVPIQIDGFLQNNGYLVEVN